MGFDPEKLDAAVDAMVAATEWHDYMWDPPEDYRGSLFLDAYHIVGEQFADDGRRAAIAAAVAARLRERWAEFRAIERRMADSAPKRARRKETP